jgi:general secretion pathway protein C
VTETEFEVRRSMLPLLGACGDPFSGRSARIVPLQVGDQVVGVKVFGIRKDSLFDELGLQNGDLVRAVDGKSLANPQVALDVAEYLPTAKRVSLAITRAGTDMVITYVITDERKPAKRAKGAARR